MSRPIEQELTPENYAQLLKEYQAKYGQAEGSDALHRFALNQGFSMNGNARVTGVKWVRGEVHDNGVLVQGLHAADPTQLTLFPNQ